ncbi:hypothetical protein GPECTOR_3g408 [Gonium pectorale]|uniref:Uncharacterized protein n=1 Tax=Gonium pectorale TaxID=33097 RepID=A0A150GZJ9_GONPE|nr:hypothetical protein GPECTOR_3g408 [Gonium pectorale]|eukprot:KXZ55271.1 hypothetical protein GPECTOR_3g408 [Gonium pectorale]
MGFFDEADDGDIFGKASKGAGAGGAAPSKTKAAPAPKAKAKFASVDDDDDDNMFDDFLVEPLEKETAPAAAPPPPAPAAAASEKPAATAAGPSTSTAVTAAGAGELDDDTALLDDDGNLLQDAEPDQGLPLAAEDEALHPVDGAAGQVATVEDPQPTEQQPMEQPPPAKELQQDPVAAQAAQPMLGQEAQPQEQDQQQQPLTADVAYGLMDGRHEARDAAQLISSVGGTVAPAEPAAPEPPEVAFGAAAASDAAAGPGTAAMLHSGPSVAAAQRAGRAEDGGVLIALPPARPPQVTHGSAEASADHVGTVSAVNISATVPAAGVEIPAPENRDVSATGEQVQELNLNGGGTAEQPTAAVANNPTGGLSFQPPRPPSGSTGSVPMSTPVHTPAPTLFGPALTPASTFSLPVLPLVSPVTDAPMSSYAAAAGAPMVPAPAAAGNRASQLGASATGPAAASTPPGLRPAAWAGGCGADPGPGGSASGGGGAALAASLEPSPGAAVPPDGSGGSLASTLNDPIKALEMMFLEAQSMRDQLMDLRVAGAVLSNRMVRLDNPMLRDRLSGLKREAAEALRISDALAVELLPPPPPAPAPTAGAGAAMEGGAGPGAEAAIDVAGRAFSE